jgi:copper chaperone CopZ
MTEKSFVVPNISCHHCGMTIKRELKELEGVARVDVDIDAKTVTVAWEAPADWDGVKSLLTEINYAPAD